MPRVGMDYELLGNAGGNRGGMVLCDLVCGVGGVALCGVLWLGMM